MSFNIKIALLTSVAFISGFCWVVNRFGRPLIEEAAGAAIRPGPVREPGVARARAGATGFDVTPSGSGLSRPSVVSAVAPPALPVSRALPPVRGSVALAAGAALPPLMNSPTEHVEPVPSGLLMAESTPAPDSSAATPSAAAAPRPDGEVLVPNLKSAPERGTREPIAAAPPGATNEPGQLSGDATQSTYVVQRGDSLTKIARKVLGRDDAAALQAFVAANPQLARRNNAVHLGETLVVPSGGAPAAAQSMRESRATLASGGPKPRAAERGGDKPSEPGKAPPSATKRRAKSPPADGGARVAAASGASGRAVGSKPGETRGPKWYTIRESDSLKRIARREMKNENRWREIAQLNGLKDGAKLAAGTKIKLPGDERIAQR